MKSIALAVGLAALAAAASTPARADYAVVRYDTGHCQIWWDSSDNPWGTGWTKLVVGLPNWDAAEAALYDARAQDACH